MTRWNDGRPDALIPDEAIGSTATLVLLAVLDGCRDITAICERVGRSRQPVHRHLTRLKALGLVAWEYHTAGTLRPACRVVPTIGSVPVHEDWWG
jgi:hypothetical protein